MTLRVFVSRPLPGSAAESVRARLATAHGLKPFSVVDSRESVGRAAAICHELGLTTTVYRGGLVLVGAEIDHRWLDVDGHVLDVTFPLFHEAFVVALRAFVAGDADADDLRLAAAPAGVSKRVLGRFPEGVRYLGKPVWAARGSG